MQDFLAPTDEVCPLLVYANIVNNHFYSQFAVRNNKNSECATNLHCDFVRTHRLNTRFVESPCCILQRVFDCSINMYAVWSECLARFKVFDVKARAPLDSTPSLFDRQGRGNLLIRGSGTRGVSSTSSEKPHPRNFKISSTQHDEKRPCKAYCHLWLRGKSNVLNRWNTRSPIRSTIEIPRAWTRKSKVREESL